MVNDINARYFDYCRALSSSEQAQILAQIAAETGFVAEREVYRGKIYQPDKITDITFRGKLDAGSRLERPADLKVQFAQPEVEEAEIIRAGQAVGVGVRMWRNLEADKIEPQSSLISLPEIYLDKPWDNQVGYGYLVTRDYSSWKPIFSPGLVDSQDRQNFTSFYDRYHHWYCQSHWQVTPTTLGCSAYDWVTGRVERWSDACDKKGRLHWSKYRPYHGKFCRQVESYFYYVPMVWGNRHLTGWDVRVNPRRSHSEPDWIITRNLFWGFIPQWYDLVFPIWHNLTQYPLGWSVDYVQEDVKAWLGSFKVPSSHRFGDGPKDEKTFWALLAERMLGAIMMDDGVDDRFAGPEKAEALQYYVELHQSIFDWAIERFLKS